MVEDIVSLQAQISGNHLFVCLVDFVYSQNK